MGCMAVVVHAGKHQRCNPEPELKLTSVTLVVSYPFSSSESTLAPLRNNNVSSSWHPELGGALARPSLHQHGGKGVPKIAEEFQNLALGGTEGSQNLGGMSAQK